jgi:hypothetical protein
MFKHPWVVLGLWGCLVNLAACSPYVSWKEEVKLNDGRVIVVEQRKLMEGGIDRESWLTISLAELDSRPIIWHEHLGPLILNIDGGMLYVVGTPWAGREVRMYDCPEHSVVGFIWQNNHWTRIPFAKIPESIYNTNMLIDAVPPRGTSFLTIAEKNSKTLNGESTHRLFWKWDPNRRNGC